jgi:nucleoside-diphosphate-sugar epimerase
MKKILIAGGAGYVGSVLCPALVRRGYSIRVFDTFWFWDSPEEFLTKTQLNAQSQVEIIHGDLRNRAEVRRALQNVDTVIQLACISNDPSSDLDPEFTHSINYTGNVIIIDEAKKLGIEKFVFTSSSSVYGIKDEPQVTEDMSLKPLTQYSKLKVAIENYLLTQIDQSFKAVIIRPSTICGFSPRQRLDVVVNMLTDFAINQRKIRVFGGDQLRPNIHIKDIVALYIKLVETSFQNLSGKIFNAGWDNLKVKEIAEIVSEVVGKVEKEFVPTNDNRSYHVSSERVWRELGFKSERTVQEAVQDLVSAFRDGQISDPSNSRHHNVRQMQAMLQKSN